ncbi:MAG: hypothetical protein ACI9XP_000355 [Lentimonas sp.]|jgi:hypothetical protein
MSKLSFSISALLMIAVCFSSCTIQKRVHTSGYHVAWKNQNRSSAKKEIKSDELASQPEKQQVTEPNHTLTEIKKTENTNVEQSNILASIEGDLTVSTRSESQKLVSFKNVRTVTNEIEVNSNLKTETKKPKNVEFKRLSRGGEINKLGLISFICAFLCFLFIGILPAMICGAISLSQFKQYPGRYQHKWMSVIGVVVGFIFSVLATSFLLILAIMGDPIFFVLAGIFLAAIIFSGIMISLYPRR